MLFFFVFVRNYVPRSNGGLLSGPSSQGFSQILKKRRCISPPNLAYLFPINSGHSVKISTPGHLISGHQVSLSDLISQCILTSLLSCPSESDRRSDFTLTEYDKTTWVYNRVSQILAVCGLMSCHFLCGLLIASQNG